MLELFGFFLVAFGIPLSIFVFLERHRRSQWAGMAEELSLQFRSEAFVAHQVFGSYRDRPILVDTWLTHRGFFRSTVGMRVRLPVRNLHGLRIRVNRRGFIGRIARRRQPRERPVTGRAVSDLYRVKLRPPRFAARLLGSDTPFGRLLQRREAHTLRVVDDELYFVKLGVHHSREKMVALVNMLLSGAERCEQVVENELPPRFSQRKALPSAAKYIALARERDKKQLKGVQPSTLSTLFVVMLISLTCFLPTIFVLLLLVQELNPF